MCKVLEPFFYWIFGEDGLNFDFMADTAPFTYEATITDLSISSNIGLEDIFLSITTSTEYLADRFSEGSITFPVIGGNTYFANVFAQGAGLMEAGNFGLIVETVPIPGAVWLLGPGLVCLVGLRKKLKK
jgi:hypothetical protein